MTRPFAEWKEEYLIGITEIDEQHMSLVNIINDLHAGFSLNGQANRTATFKNAVKNTIEYVKTHFYKEEKYMARYRYPGLNEQQDIHKDFIVELLSNVKSYESNNMRAPIDILVFFKDWLLKHIAVEDKKMGLFIKQKKLAKTLSE